MSKLLVAALFLVFSILPAWGVVDMGNSAVTRLWSDSGYAYACTGVYLRQYKDAGAWIASAGHCTRNAKYAKRSATDFISSYIDWRASIANYAPESQHDIALGTMPDPRIGPRVWYSFLADKMPTEGVVYVHGFPAGVERVVQAMVVGKPKEYTDSPWSWEIETPAIGDITHGSSGSPVLNVEGFVVGIVWGVRVNPYTGEKTNRAIVTDIAALHALLKMTGIKLE